MHKIVISNQKGGIGKTTLCVNLSACLAKLGKKVLLVDLDRQGHSSIGLGIKSSNVRTIAELLSFDECKVEDVLQKTYINGLDILPSDISLSVAEYNLAQTEGREFVLREKLKYVKYDYIIIDTGPAFNVLLTNAFLVAEHIIIPMNLHFYALAGIQTLIDTINKTNVKVGSLVNHKLTILGVVFNMFKTQSNISKDIFETLNSIFGERIFQTYIRENVKIMESQKKGISVLDHDPKNIICETFKNLTNEVIGRLENV